MGSEETINVKTTLLSHSNAGTARIQEPLTERCMAAGLLSAPFVLAKQWLKVRYEKSKIGKTEKHFEGKVDGLKLAYLRTDFWFNLKAGGSVGHTAGVISGLRDLGVNVFCISTDDLFGVDKTHVRTHVVCPPRSLNVFTSLSRLVYNTVFVDDSLEILSKEKPDLIYQRYSRFNYSGVTLSRHLSIPFVLEFNSSEVWKMKHWSNRRIRSFPLLRAIEMLNLMSADVVIAVSEVLKKDLASWGIDESKILVNPNAVDPRKFSPEIAKSQRTRKLKQGLGIDDDEVVVGFTGTFGAWHGIPQLTEAIDCILREQLPPNIRFLLMGDGPLKSDMERQIGHYEKVTFTGEVPYSDIQCYLSICDILVSPHCPQMDGREFFGSPTKLFEYMAMGKAIVASNLGQIGQVLKDDKTAVLVEPGNIKDLMRGVKLLVDDLDLRRRLGENAREEVVEKYTWKKHTEKTVNKIREILN